MYANSRTRNFAMDRGGKDRRSPDLNEAARTITKYFPQNFEEGDAGKFKLRLISDLLNFFSTPQGQQIVSQDVVEIMKESLYDKYVDEHGVVDFARSGGMSQQKEAKRFLSALNKQSESQQKDCFTISELYTLANRISLRVPDVDTLLDNLNSNGYLLKKGPKTYQVLSSSYSRSQAQTEGINWQT